MVALSPAVLIMILIRTNSGGQREVIFALNGLLSFVGSYGLLRRPRQHPAITALAAVFLAVFFWGFNSLVGVLGGCAYSSGSF